MRRDGMAIMAAQVVTLIVMVGFIHVIDTGLTPPPDFPPASEAPPLPRQADATFGGQMKLLGYDGQVEERDGERYLRLTLAWRALDVMGEAYWFGAIPVAPDGTVGEALDWQPHYNGSLYPTTCWRPGEVVTDTVEIPLGDLPPEGLWVSLMVHNVRAGRPLEVISPGTEPDSQLGIGPFPVE